MNFAENKRGPESRPTQFDFGGDKNYNHSQHQIHSENS